MGEFMKNALLWSSEIVKFREAMIPKVQNMEKEMMDLEIKRLLDWGDQLVGSRSTKEETQEKKSTQLPEITPWQPRYDVQQLCFEMSELKRVSENCKASTIF